MKKNLLFGVFVAFALSLTSSRATDYFSEVFSYTNFFDLDGLSLTFTPDGSEDYYSASGALITELPVDASTHDRLDLLDDTSVQVWFDETTFSLYGGADNSKVNIGSNGYLTFNEYDTTYIANITNHFDTGRISTLYRDLNPAAGGSVRYMHLEDRFVVTFLEVPNFGSSSNNLNTFQTELFYGDGSIRMSWLNTAAYYSSIVGLSEGNRVPVDFVETDMSGLAWDLDGDTIPNSWEFFHFSNFTGCDASADSDGDGMDNLSEYICDTDPRDRMSVFSAVYKSSAAGGTIIEWIAAEGRIYNIFESHNLGFPNSFSAVPGDFVFPNNSYTTDVAVANDQGFYKIDVKLDD